MERRRDEEGEEGENGEKERWRRGEIYIFIIIILTAKFDC